MNPLTDFTETSTVMTALLEQLSPEHMSRPTPCEGWSVQDLTDHVIANQYFFAGAAGSTSQPTEGAVTPENAVSRYQAATDNTLGTYGAPGMMDRDLETPFGTFPGAMVLAVAFADQLTHCWDLARSIGATAVVTDELVGSAQAAWEAFIQEGYRDGSLFGQATELPAGAPALDRLAAFTGRTV